MLLLLSIFVSAISLSGLNKSKVKQRTAFSSPEGTKLLRSFGLPRKSALNGDIEGEDSSPVSILLTRFYVTSFYMCYQLHYN